MAGKPKARLDVVGYRHWHLHPETISHVLDQHPRLNLKQKSYAGFDAQASKWFTRRAPFEE